MEERTIKELLQLMFDNQNLFRFGLCHWNEQLFRRNLLTNIEYWKLSEYIIINRPSKFSSIDAFVHRNSVMYWEVSNINPRIKWLKKHINKL
jgi:hypothetical protein